MLSNLRFVRSGDEDEAEEGMLQRAVEEVRKKGVEPEWMGPGITTVDKGLVYVLDNFDCPDFKLLHGKCRIIGPAVVLAHVSKGWPLPASTQPVFSMAMRGVVACFTQTGAREKRERLSQLVKLMGGKVQRDYTKHVTHLIAGQVGSTKYNVARDLGMPVMLPSWVDHCWNCGLDSYVSALDSETLKAHSCPPFTGCTVTVTGLEERERRRVREVVEANGGVYSGELTKDVCTHLLVGSTTSAKYKFAQQWQVHCVSSQWLYDSAERGYCQSETSYSVEEGGGGGGGKRKTDNISSVGGPPEWKAALGDYQLPGGVCETGFLEGCRLFLAGFTDQELEKLHRIINLGGGARYNHLSESLTHVVLGVQEPSTITSIRNLGEIPHVVNVLWLLACCTSGERVEECQYTCLEPLPSRGEEGDVGGGRRKRRRGEEEEGGGGGKRPRVGGRVEGEKAEDNDGDDETVLDDEEALLLQYQNAEFPMADKVGGGGGGGGRGGEGGEGKEGSGILLGKRFAVSCLFSSDDQSLATSVLSQQGGKVVDVAVANYLLTPLEVVNKTGPGRQKELNSQATPITMIWLQRSIEAGKALEPSSNYLFQPLAVNLVKTTLTGCVLAFSQSSDLEREHLIRFSKGLGAVVQDYFTHYPGHGLLATTHIILKTAQGDKYDRAIQWGVPALSDSWLFACAESGSIVPEEPHLLHPAPPPHHDTTETREGGGEGRPGDGDETTLAANDGGRVEGEVISDNEAGPPPTDFDVQRGEAGLTEEGGTRGDTESLAGVVICLHKKIPSPAQMHNLAGSLGADCHWSLDESCTHYVYQGRAAEAVRDREVRAARERGCLIVSPHWIHACVSEGRRVEETSYPHTYNPNMALTLTQQRREVKPRIESHDNHVTVQAGTNGEGDGCERREGGHSDKQEEEEEGREEGKEEEEGKGEREEADLTSEVVRKFQQQLEEIKVAPREARRRKSRRLEQKEPEPVAPSLPPPRTRPSPALPSYRRSRRNRKKSEPLTDSQISDSQVLQVTYDDPEGRREKAKLLAMIEREEKLRAQGLDPDQYKDTDSTEGRNLRLDLAGGPHCEATTTAAATDSSGVQTTVAGRPDHPQAAASHSDPLRNEGRSAGATVVSGGMDEKDAPSSTPLPPSLGVPIVTHAKRNQEVKSLFDEKTMQTRRKPKTPPKFLLSSLEQREKLDYGALIQELGGEYIDVDYFTTNCTHLVVGKASRTEKFLGACAAGKWVLHKSYMEACRAERKFVEEEDHEWGVNTGGNELQPLEYAPRRWRVALAQQRKMGTAHGAFQGWKALLFAERNKMAGLKRLLEAGGAKVCMTGTKLTVEELKQVTHAFINMNYFPKDSLSLEGMVKCGVHCLKPDYIAEYLSKGKDVPVEPYFINEVKPLLRRYEE